MIDNKNGTVSDEDTGLMWQQKTPETKMTWDQAMSYCKELNLAGHTDWRLPTIQELLNLVDYNKYSPAINLEYFPDTVSSFYWSSTTYALYMNYGWGVNFTPGFGNYFNRNHIYYVRAVRGGVYDR